MRPTCALYVDAGYLLAAAATRVAGTSLRAGVHVEYRTLLEALTQQAEDDSQLPLLRTHWYDSARNGVPSCQQERIGELPRVKLRLGRFSVDGEQKGVDLRIGLDLVAHARNDAADVFYLLSGDDDLTEAVEEAQALGVQVVLLAVPNEHGKPHSVSRHLRRAADELLMIPADVIDQTVVGVDAPGGRAEQKKGAVEEAADPPAAPTSVPDPGVATPKVLAGAVGAPGTSTPSIVAYSGRTGGPSHVAPGYGGVGEHDDQIDQVVGQVLAAYQRSAGHGELTKLSSGRPSIPRDIDKALLMDLSDALDMYDLTDPVRFRLRSRFWDRYDELANS